MQDALCLAERKKKNDQEDRMQIDEELDKENSRSGEFTSLQEVHLQENEFQNRNTTLTEELLSDAYTANEKLRVTIVPNGTIFNHCAAFCNQF